VAKAIDIYVSSPIHATISQTSVRREWMDDTWDKHAYRCFPVNTANAVGLSISFPEDITFIWDGISDSTPDHIKILAGEKYCSTARGNATISFNTGLVVKTDETTSIMSIVPPNFFLYGAEAFTSVMSTSFYNQAFPVAWRATAVNVPITIPAGFPVATLIPISLKELAETEINFWGEDPEKFGNDWLAYNSEYGKTVGEISMSGKWADFYRNAVDHRGNSIGSHEVSALRLKINDHSKKN
jgi:Family of unknown function (DUF6065)